MRVKANELYLTASLMLNWLLYHPLAKATLTTTAMSMAQTLRFLLLILEGRIALRASGASMASVDFQEKAAPIVSSQPSGL